MEDYTVVVEGEVVKKAGKTAIDRFCKKAKGKLSTRNTIIMLVTNDDGSKEILIKGLPINVISEIAQIAVTQLDNIKSKTNVKTSDAYYYGFLKTVEKFYSERR